MKNLEVLNRKGERLFAGTKQECMHFIKCRKYTADEISLQIIMPKTHITTVAPVKPKLAGFFKNIFYKDK